MYAAILDRAIRDAKPQGDNLRRFSQEIQKPPSKPKQDSQTETSKKNKL
jgi:hypothetical protein